MLEVQRMDLPDSMQTWIQKVPTQLCKPKAFRHSYNQIRIRMKALFYLPTKKAILVIDFFNIPAHVYFCGLDFLLHFTFS